MDVANELIVSAGIEETWELLADVEYLAACWPGATLTSVEGDAFEGTLALASGSLSWTYGGSGVVAQRDQESHQLVVEAHGTDAESGAEADAQLTATLNETDAGTLVEVLIDLAPTGESPELDPSVVQQVADALVSEFGVVLEYKLTDPRGHGLARMHNLR